MEVEEQIEKFRDFFESQYQKSIHSAVDKGKQALVIDFSKLAEFDPEVSELLLEAPDDILKTGEMALHNLGIENGLRLRIENLPETQKFMIRNIRSAHINKFIAAEGIVRQASDVRPQVTSARFECPSCGNNLTILQLDTKFKEPSRCSCGRKGKFRLVGKELVDAQRIVLEESPETLEGGEQPKRIAVFLKEDLVDPSMEKRTTPGSKVRVLGQLREVPIFLSTGVQSIRLDIVVEANFVEPIEEAFDEVEIDNEDVKKLMRLKDDPQVYEKLVKSVAPSIYGHEKIKEALVLQLMGGVRKLRNDGTKTRGDIHVLLVGDPGAAKSTLLSAITNIAPRSRLIAGRSSSAAGITASVVRDEFTRGFALEAGAIVLANKGILCLHPSTEVIAEGRQKKISELFDVQKSKKTVQGDEIVEYHGLKTQIPTLDIEKLEVAEGNATRIRRKFYKGKMVRLKFKSGFSIQLTPEHKIVDGRDLSWKEAREFSKSEKVVSPLKLPSIKSEIYFLDIIPGNWKVSLSHEEKSELRGLVEKKFKSFVEFNKKFGLDRHYLSGGKQPSVNTLKKVLKYFNKYGEWKKRPLKFTRSCMGERLRVARITPEMGYILGFIYGDGSVNVSKRRTRISVIQSFNHQEYTDQFEKCWNKVFEKPISSIVYNSSCVLQGNKIRSTGKQFYNGSNLLGEIYKNFVGRDLKGVHRFNDKILNAFLAGVMDSDGCITTKSSRGYDVQHALFIFDVRNRRANLNFITALRRLDCYGQLNKDSRGYYVVEVTGREDIKVLKEGIEGFSIKAKNFILKGRGRNLSSTSQKVPVDIASRICRRIAWLSSKSELLEKGLWSTIYRYKEKTLEPSRIQLERMRENLRLIPVIREEIEKMIKRDYFLDEIVGIREVDYEGYVYDLVVPNTHNFFAGGIIVHNCLDEMDKMTVEDTSSLHEAMEQQIISVSKANIQATLRAETTVLAAANPKLGRFDPYQPIANQINLPPALINRFDLIFPVRDLPNRERDSKIARHVLKLHQKPMSLEPEIEPSLIKKYISYARQNVKPVISDAAILEIERFYVELRNSGTSSDDEIRPIPISARQLEALVRLTEASARVRLSNKVTKADAVRAIELLKFCLMQVGFDPETGQIDIDRITTGITATQRSRIAVIREIMIQLEEGSGKKTVAVEEIITEATKRGIEEGATEEALEKLKREGQIFEPKTGWVARL